MLAGWSRPRSSSRGSVPSDGRFGCGPSKVRPEQIEAIVAGGRRLIGTSHRKPPVKNLVGQIRAGLPDLFACRTGGRSCSATAARRSSGTSPRSGLIEQRSQHLVFGEFSSKFADASTAAPHLEGADGDRERTGRSSRTARRRRGRPLRADPQRDIDRRGDEAPASAGDAGALVAVDATSAAGGLRVGPGRRRRLLLRPAEVLRQPTAGCGSRPAPRLRSSGSNAWRRATVGARPRSISASRSPTAAPTRPTTRRRSPR